MRTAVGANLGYVRHMYAPSIRAEPLSICFPVYACMPAGEYTQLDRTRAGRAAKEARERRRRSRRRNSGAGLAGAAFNVHAWGGFKRVPFFGAGMLLEIPNLFYAALLKVRGVCLSLPRVSASARHVCECRCERECGYRVRYGCNVMRRLPVVVLTV